MCPCLLDELKPVLTVSILLPRAHQGGCKNELVAQSASKSYLTRANCTELCPLVPMDRGEVQLGCEMGSAMPPAWEICPAAAWCELGPAPNTSPAGAVLRPPALAVFCTSQ